MLRRRRNVKHGPFNTCGVFCPRAKDYLYSPTRKILVGFSLSTATILTIVVISPTTLVVLFMTPIRMITTI